MWNSVTPYISFFIVLLVIVAVFPLCDKLWIPCSELSLVALFFTGKCLPSLMIVCVVDVSQVRKGSYPPAWARGILPIMVDKRGLCQKGMPFSGFRYIFVYERVGISLAEVFQKVGKSVILTYKKTEKGCSVN